MPIRAVAVLFAVVLATFPARAQDAPASGSPDVASPAAPVADAPPPSAGPSADATPTDGEAQAPAPSDAFDAAAPGARGGACYGNRTCDEGLSCDDVTQTCIARAAEGHRGGLCYGNATCNDPLVCDDARNTCVQSAPAGQLGGPCYGNRTCNDGLACTDGACHAPPEAPAAEAPAEEADPADGSKAEGDEDSAEEAEAVESPGLFTRAFPAWHDELPDAVDEVVALTYGLNALFPGAGLVVPWLFVDDAKLSVDLLTSYLTPALTGVALAAGSNLLIPAGSAVGLLGAMVLSQMVLRPSGTLTYSDTLAFNLGGMCVGALLPLPIALFGTCLSLYVAPTASLNAVGRQLSSGAARLEVQWTPPQVEQRRVTAMRF